MAHPVRNFLSFVVATLFLVGCETATTSAPSTVAPIPITAETQELLLGYWEGKWEADNGSSGDFEISIKEINASGEIHGSRLYVTKNFGSSAQPTVGAIRDGQLHLDIEKGPKSWIVLSLERDNATGVLLLRGRYSAQGGNNVYLGDAYASKWKDL